MAGRRWNAGSAEPSTTSGRTPVIRKLTLGAAFGAGSVLGAKAGQERYRQIEAKFRELAGMPAVQDLTSNIAARSAARTS